MKIVNIRQGTEEWLDWRKTVITATDAPAILGSSPWSTPYKCWQKKLDLIPEEKENSAMERGKRLEPLIRERFIRDTGIFMVPENVESTDYEFLGASLDGLSDCHRYILEVKTGNSHLHSMAEKNEIPLYYMHQMQHQLLVTGAEKCFYRIGSENATADITIEVLPDPEFVNLFIPKAREFWKYIAYREAPPLHKKDYVDKGQNQLYEYWSQEYKKSDDTIKKMEEKKEEARKHLILLSDDQSSCGNGIKITKTYPRGRVDYNEIPELKDVDIEKYRKPSNVVWKITLDKE